MLPQRAGAGLLSCVARANFSVPRTSGTDATAKSRCWIALMCCAGKLFCASNFWNRCYRKEQVLDCSHVLRGQTFLCLELLEPMLSQRAGAGLLSCVARANFSVPRTSG